MRGCLEVCINAHSPLVRLCIESEDGFPVVDRFAFEEHVEIWRRMASKSAAKEHKRQARAYACSLIAGPYSELFKDDDCRDDIDPKERYLAIAVADLLDEGGDEYSRLFDFTIDTLLRPEVDKAIHCIAGGLYRSGELKGRRHQKLLPAPVPNFPPPPPKRRRGKNEMQAGIEPNTKSVCRAPRSNYT